MKNLRTVAIAFALTLVAAAAAIPTVNAGDKSSNKVVFRAAAPVAVCAPGDPNGCGIYR